ncbi:hypothetical protein LOZ16_006135 [Ophidiomyces ophidiicola]|nr:hypothetical protein LOZ16_006135 [Ophidiomyces ophidiicola]KAI2322259.1 hypothetical protein LOZ01_004688 [Ophidiomyces ophidiicola]KAI2434155.1 hypothetical protein LOZ19_004996 [Ophidiomyces ophidiicola]KAI2454865.1 hypothetical protein LOZ30_000255 [Ophidiomyces ophidiicola]
MEPSDQDAESHSESSVEQAPPDVPVKLGRSGALAALVAFGTGVALGASHGSQKSALRFRAENAHRFPTDPTGWYQYHKSKNYVSMLGGLKEGVKLGTKLSVGVLGFSLLENIVDQARPGNRDFLSTVTAGLTFSGIYSLIARHDVYTAARISKLGLKFSLVYGLGQDLLALGQGRKPGYIAWIYKGKDSTSEAV